MSELYQLPDAASLDFKTELLRMTQRMERGALELRQAADHYDTRAAEARESARRMEEKAERYRALHEIEPSRDGMFDDGVPY